VEASNTPTIRRLHPFTPSPTSAHSSAPRGARQYPQNQARGRLANFSGLGGLDLPSLRPRRCGPARRNRDVRDDNERRHVR